MSTAILITDVNIFAGINGALIEKADVLVKGKLKKTISTKKFEASGGLIFLS